MTILSWVCILALIGSAASATPIATVAELQKGHRLLIVSGPAGDQRTAAQQAALDAWDRQGVRRDVVPLAIEGSNVVGASDAASSTRVHYAMPSARFALTLVGKDGHVVRRLSRPATGKLLGREIDAINGATDAVEQPITLYKMTIGKTGVRR